MPIKLTVPLIKDAEPTPKELIQKMADNYSSNIRSMSNVMLSTKFPTMNKKQASCLWISVDELNQLIKDNNADGIRIYFGQHVEESLPTDKPNYVDLISAIFVATKDTKMSRDGIANSLTSEDQLNENFDPLQANSVAIAGPFTGQGSDKVPVCDPDCPLVGMMKIKI